MKRFMDKDWEKLDIFSIGMLAGSLLATVIIMTTLIITGSL